MPDETIPSWLRVEERTDGPSGFPYAVIIRDEIASWSTSRENADVMLKALASAWYAEMKLEASGLLEDA